MQLRTDVLEKRKNTYRVIYNTLFSFNFVETLYIQNISIEHYNKQGESVIY